MCSISFTCLNFENNIFSWPFNILKTYRWPSSPLNIRVSNVVRPNYFNTSKLRSLIPGMSLVALLHTSSSISTWYLLPEMWTPCLYTIFYERCNYCFILYRGTMNPFDLYYWNRWGCLSTYCLDNDQIHFKTNFTVHFLNYIKNNSANRRWRKAQTVAAILFGLWCIRYPLGKNIFWLTMHNFYMCWCGMIEWTHSW